MMARSGTDTGDLWGTTHEVAWRSALDRYPETVRRQGVEGLEAMDGWVRSELPRLISSRDRPHVTLDELVQVTKWKMSRGVWRGRNLALVRANEPEEVIRISGDALAGIPDPRAPIRILAWLDGVGPATASAVAAAAAPQVYPFFDDVAAAQIPGLGKVAYTSAYYARYSEELRERARKLGDAWTPAMVERALWSHAGGKVGLPSVSDQGSASARST